MFVLLVGRQRNPNLHVIFFSLRGICHLKAREELAPVPKSLDLTVSLVPLQASQGPSPACPQCGGCGCPQPGSHGGPCAEGVPRWHEPVAAAAPPRGHFWLLCGLREWAQGLRYALPFLSKLRQCLWAEVCSFWSLAEWKDCLLFLSSSGSSS
jgi:hypothetical protein